MRIEYSTCLVKGGKKEKNEDRIMINNKVIAKTCISGVEEQDLMSLVCVEGGAKEADMIVESFKNFQIRECSPYSLSVHLNSVNAAVVSEQFKNEMFHEMLSTATGIFIADSKYILFNLGDIRIYMYLDGVLSLITKNKMVRRTNDAFNYRDTLITSYIGGSGNACTPFIRKGIAKRGSIFILCNKGIYKSISEKNLEKILSSNYTLNQKKRGILKLSLQNASNDDMSLILLKCEA